MAYSSALAEYEALLEEIGPGVPNTEQYQRMSSLVLDVPEARALAAMNPFLPDYKAAAMKLYLHLRGRSEQGYVAARDEAPSGALPANLWQGLIPWSFRDSSAVAEHVLAWGNILSHLNLPPGGSLLEYGPGSGQVLLMAARMGYRACGADIDAVALQSIDGQAAHLGLTVHTERAEFGHGFSGETFDTILFYEAFHHAFHFEDLLVSLHERLKPGGRIVLCGEPIVGAVCEAVPYPWGPRLDALSVFCMRKFGWMELGFTHDYLMKIAELTGWQPKHYPSAATGRASVYVLEVNDHLTWTRGREAANAQLRREVERLRDELAAVHASTSWRLTRPVRAVKTFFGLRRADAPK